jgi:hypothetical protein
VSARAEIEDARKNREADVGVFVFAKASAPQGLQPFTRIDHDLYVVWDSMDPGTDVYLSAAVSVAKALLFRQKVAENKGQGDLDGIENAVDILEKQLKGLEEMQTWTTTSQSTSDKIAGKIVKLRDTAKEQIQQLRDCLDALRAEGHAQQL